MNDSPYEKMTELDKAVLDGTNEKILEVMNKNGKRVSTASGLGFACCSKGLDTVKFMVENGASFKCPKTYIGYFRFFRREFKKTADYSLFILDDISKYSRKWEDTEMLPLEKRLEILEYLCENEEKVFFKKDVLLYFTILEGCEEMYDLLKRYGAVIPDDVKEALTGEGVNTIRNDFLSFTQYMTVEILLKTLKLFEKELDGCKLRFTDAFLSGIKYKLADPRVIEPLESVFDMASMSKPKLIRAFIDIGSVPCLEFAEKQGWLNQPKVRDEMIDYSAESDQTECSAWLLDFKNRTADFAKEAENREKRLNSILNASPDSVAELKKIWSYEKLEDGTLSIKSYKGNQTVVTVPEKIGNAVVSEIGAWAFSPLNSRISEERRKVRESIEKVILPDGLRKIGAKAFNGCKALKEINIPNSVKEIEEEALFNCGFKNLVIPEGVIEIGYRALGSNEPNALMKITLPSTLNIFSENNVDFTAPPIWFYRRASILLKIPDMPAAIKFCNDRGFKFKIK